MERSFSRNFLIPALIFFLALFLYSKTAKFDFVWDDERTHLTGNRNLVEGKVSYFWKNTYEGLYVPVPYTLWSQMVKWQKDPQQKLSSPLKPAPFHWLNIFLFSFSCTLLYYILLLFGVKAFSAFAGTLVFTLHPLQVESVAWISEARGLLAVCFIFSAFVFYFLFRKGRTGCLAFAAVCFALALLSKPSAAAFPLAIFLIEWFHFSSRNLKRYLPAFFFLALALPVIFLMPGLQKSETISWPLWKRIFLVFYSIDFYLLKSVLPTGLSPSYGLTLPHISGALLYLSPLPIAVLGALLFYLRKKTGSVGLLSFLLFVAFLLPVSGMVHFYFQKFSTVADRYACFSLFALALSAAFAFEKLNTAYFKVVYALVLVFFAYQARAYTETWKNEISVWKYADEKYPGQLHVNNNLGIAYHDAKQYGLALEKYDCAIGLDSNLAKIYTNRGNTFSFLKDFDKALADYNRAILLDSAYAGAYYNRAVTYYVLDRNYEAWDDLLKAKSLGYVVNPDFEKGLKNSLNR